MVTKEKSGEGKETSAGNEGKERIYRKSNIPVINKIERDWVDTIKDYYYGEEYTRNGVKYNESNGFAKWAGLSLEQKNRIESLIKDVDEKSELATAVKLWQEVHKIWLEKTDTIDSETAKGLIERTSKENLSAYEARNIARESLAHHVNYYMPIFVGIFEKNGYFSEREFKETEEREEFKNPANARKYLVYLMDHNDRIKSGNYRKRDGTEASMQELEEMLKRNREEAEAVLHKTMKHWRQVIPRDVRFGMTSFYNNYNEMNTIHYSNLKKKTDERDYSGNDSLWAHMYRFSLSAYRGHMLAGRERENVTTPPPPEGTMGKGNGVISPPPSLFDFEKGEGIGESSGRKMAEAQKAAAERVADTLLDNAKPGNPKQAEAGSVVDNATVAEAQKRYQYLHEMGMGKGYGVIRAKTGDLLNGKLKGVKIETDDGKTYVMAGSGNSMVDILSVEGKGIGYRIPLGDEELKVGKPIKTAVVDDKGRHFAPKVVSKITVYPWESTGNAVGNNSLSLADELRDLKKRISTGKKDKEKKE
ncbi:MAG: hypothetical protein KGI06_04270 [Candidatus Micrarchaeota archaeon]|nr:hypothetical protein [Candidatus Micrarchaeota archaeon]